MEKRGAIVVTTSLKHCAFDTSLESGIYLPGLDGDLPDGVFVRAISKGSLEEITFRLGILHALEASGVRVWNRARVIERCVDKSTATFLFQRAGLRVPVTRTAEGLDAAREYAEGRLPLVAKPMFGSQGNGVRRVDKLDDLPTEDDIHGVYYLQQYLRAPDADEFVDWRVFVSANRILGSMARGGPNWITNVHQGGRPLAVEFDEEVNRLALAAARAVGADYAGVDLIRDPGGQLMVLEINSNPAWKGLQSITDCDIAGELANDFLVAVSGAKAGRSQ
ncbi:MAG: RimK family alpha-L-glutamate ligase [Alphaproteobacteria bacterium]|nr:RimK family alpha-L-glutamate ligase [Alphaproteobacteria bacterium]